MARHTTTTAENSDAETISDAKNALHAHFRNQPDTESVAHFRPGPGIERLSLKFDIDRMQSALKGVAEIATDQGAGFRALPLTQRPGDTEASANDLSGRYYLRANDQYREEAREALVDERAFSEFDPRFKNTYFADIHAALSELCAIGRMRILFKAPYNCNSWHRDPEPRLHIPIFTNPGCLFIVNHHCTHLPADGSVYFTDTRAYHTALNGGETSRVHIVAALPDGMHPGHI